MKNKQPESARMDCTCPRCDGGNVYTSTSGNQQLAAFFKPFLIVLRCHECCTSFLRPRLFVRYLSPNPPLISNVAEPEQSTVKEMASSTAAVPAPNVGSMPNVSQMADHF